MKRFAAAALAALMAAGLSGCGWQTVDPDEARESIQVIAMDTVMIFTVYGEKSTHAGYLSEDEVRRLEALLSRTDSESVVSQLNSAGGLGISVGEEVGGLLAAADDHALLGGARVEHLVVVVSALGALHGCFPFGQSVQ